jgi:hypothetical protein
MIRCSYCGKENDDADVRCYDCATDFQSLPKSENLPPPPSPKVISPEALEPAFSFEDGFHRTDWNFVRAWINSQNDPLAEVDAWNDAALLWVSKLGDDLGGTYFVVQSPQTILLSDLPVETARRLLDYAGRAAATIEDRLGEIAWDGARSKDVVLLFSDQDDYYQYLSHHSPDGEQASSGGVCIHSGYTHIAIPWRDELDAANAVVHELTHDCLAHLSLPLWLNEGVAVTLQKEVAPQAKALDQSDREALSSAMSNWRPSVMWDELAESHFAFWNEMNIQSFWAGTSFYQPGDSNSLSYSLAEVFLKLLSERGNAPTFRAFLRAPKWDDAGQTAALDILNVDLGEIAATFLGEGNWRPQRKSLIACWEATGWNPK